MLLSVSTIVPVSRSDTLRQTIDALLNQSVPWNRYEIILVVPSWIPFKNPSPSRIKTIKTPKLFPPGKMRNIGAKQAFGEILFFIDDDCIPPLDWIESTSRIFLENLEIGAVGCRVIGTKDTFWERCADYALFSRYQYNSAFNGPIGSAAIAVRKEAFASVSGFEEILLASEDWDLSLKLEEKGWMCRFDPSIEVRHDHRRGNFWGIITMGFKSGFRSGLFVQEKHRNRMSVAALILLRLKRPFLYPIVIVPYAIALTLFLVWELRRTDSRIFFFSPFIFLGRLSYQVGVWVRLMRQQKETVHEGC